jgi:tRNA nucleotidyltransferase (CCA-adding enzyme)
MQINTDRGAVPDNLQTLLPISECSKRILSDNSVAMVASRGIARAVQKIPPHPECPENPPLVLIVGGYVRDILLGLHPKDIDLQVYGITPYDLELLMQHLFPGKIKIVGKAYEIIKVDIGEDAELDVAMARGGSSRGKEPFSYGDPSCSPRDAPLEKDFTFNSIAADPLSGSVFDWQGGIKDLSDDVTRITDQNIFRSNPVRVYRGLQFASRFGCLPDESSSFLMREMIHTGMLCDLHPRVLREEWYKLLVKGRQPSRGLSLARALGLFKKEYPSIHQILEENDRFNTLCQFLDALQKRKSILLVEEYKRLAFFLAAMLLLFPETDSEVIASDFFKKIGLPQHQISGISGMLYWRAHFPTLEKELGELAAIEKNLLSSTHTAPKRKLPGIKAAPVLQNRELLEVQEKKSQLEHSFLKDISPFLKNEFMIFQELKSDCSEHD